MPPCLRCTPFQGRQNRPVQVVRPRPPCVNACRSVRGVGNAWDGDLHRGYSGIKLASSSCSPIRRSVAFDGNGHETLTDLDPSRCGFGTGMPGDCLVSRGPGFPVRLPRRGPLADCRLVGAIHVCGHFRTTRSPRFDRMFGRSPAKRLTPRRASWADGRDVGNHSAQHLLCPQERANYLAAVRLVQHSRVVDRLGWNDR